MNPKFDRIRKWKAWIQYIPPCCPIFLGKLPEIIRIVYKLNIAPNKTNVKFVRLKIRN